MSGNAIRMTRAQAAFTAGRVITHIAAYCERIQIAGSLRRKSVDVGDVEIVVTPRLGADLFGDTSVNLLDLHIDWLLAKGTLTRRLDMNGQQAIGSKYKRLSYDGVPVDLFVVIPPAQWGVILAIRTGPAEFSHRLVTSRTAGGWMPPGYRVRDGALQRQRFHVDGYTATGNPDVVTVESVAHSIETIDTPEETDLFAAIGRRWIAPEDRK